MSDAPETFLWEELRGILRAAAQVRGEPAQLYWDIVLPRREARVLHAWLSALEAAARMLLAAMAARLPSPAPARRRAAEADRKERAASAPDRAPAPDLPDLAPDTEPPGSELWAGVAFRLAPGAARRGGAGGGAGRRRFLGTRGLAFRFEALIRVASAPEAYAKRLARRLHAEPDLARRLMASAPREPGRPRLYEDLLAEAGALARAALAPPAPETG